MSQGLEEYLTKKVEDIPRESQNDWKKIDAQLCAMLQQSVDSKLLVIFQAYNTCCTFWEKAKKLYSNDIQQLYNVVAGLKDLKQDSDLFSYLSTAEATIENYKKIMPITVDVKEQEKQRDRFLMVLVLAGLHSDFDALRQQVLGNAEIPTVEDLINQLLRLSSSTTTTPIITDNATLVTQTSNRRRGDGRSNRGGHGGGGRSNRPQCTLLP